MASFSECASNPTPNRIQYNLDGEKARIKNVISIVSRALWDSLPPRKVETAKGPRLIVWFSDTATPECRTFFECVSAVQELQIQHMDVLRLPDIKHNFLIGGDGRVYEGRGFGVKPSHDPFIKMAYPGVEDTLDIAYITTLEKNDTPTKKMLRATKNFLKYSKYSGNLAMIRHYEVKEWQDCPLDIVSFMKPKFKPGPQLDNMEENYYSTQL